MHRTATSKLLWLPFKICFLRSFPAMALQLFIAWNMVVTPWFHWITISHILPSTRTGTPEPHKVLVVSAADTEVETTVMEIGFAQENHDTFLGAFIEHQWYRGRSGSWPESGNVSQPRRNWTSSRPSSLPSSITEFVGGIMAGVVQTAPHWPQRHNHQYNEQRSFHLSWISHFRN